MTPQEMEARIVRYGELRPCKTAFIDAHTPGSNRKENFTIIGGYAPAEKNVSSAFFWRCRKVQGWQRDTWRFLYKNRLEQRHWNVLEQDRVAVENMEPDANQREHLYAHDMGIVRLRRHLRNLAAAQLEKAGAKS